MSDTASEKVEQARPFLELARLLPKMEPAAGHAALHALAERALAALDAGVTLRDVLEGLHAMTTPPAPVTQAEPWDELLPMTLDDFEASGTALRVFVRPWLTSLWLAGPAAAAGLQGVVWLPELVKGRAWMAAELAEAGVPGGEQTIGRLLEVLRARPEQVRR